MVLAIGYYDIPNRLGVPGEDLPHVNHYYTDAHPYYRQRVVVVGGKNSAAEACLEIFRAGGYPTLVHRHAELGSTIKYWVRPDIENRIKEGSVKARFESRVVEITPTAVVIEGPGGREELPAEGVFLLTGYRPDTELMLRAGRRLRPGDAGAADEHARRSRPTCRTCSSPAAPWPGATPATSSSRTAVSTAARSSRRSPSGSATRRLSDGELRQRKCFR